MTVTAVPSDCCLPKQKYPVQVGGWNAFLDECFDQVEVEALDRGGSAKDSLT